MNAPASLFAIRGAFIAMFLAPLGAPGASAGETIAPAASEPNQAHCKALGDGFFAVKGSTGCVRISGYIAAGVEFAAPAHPGGGGAGPFSTRVGVGSDTHVGVNLDARFDTEFGSSRLYVQVGKDHFQP